MISRESNRRSFIKKSILGTGAAILGPSQLITAAEHPGQDSEQKLPREVWIATLSQQGMVAENHKEMIKVVTGHIRQLAIYHPDIYCLPETFPFVNNVVKIPDLKEIAESVKDGGPIISEFSNLAKELNAYIICPVYITENGKYYNSAVIIDRNGSVAGEYRKIHPAPGEIEIGITPGPPDPPVFITDFGTIGIQICFDIKWQDAWKKLSHKGAEIVFWPSAFAGGKMLKTMAWLNQYYTVSSPWKDTARICDISGEELAWTGRWAPNWICAPVNLEKVFLHAWPFCERFDEVHYKYGKKVRIQLFHEEEWATIESRSPDIKVADIIKEFDFKIQKDYLREAEKTQNRTI
jgi:predicted amidohydrolase